MIHEYIGFLRDRNRIDLFRRAIEEVVAAEDVVVEVGAGLGTYSFFAVRAGARKVYAIEAGKVHELLAAVIRDNGFEGRVHPIATRAEELSFDSKADVLITEDFGTLLLDSDLESLLVRPRQTLLKPNGRIIPHRARLCFAPVECLKTLSDADPWVDEQFGYGLKWDRVRAMGSNVAYHAKLQPSQMLATAAVHSDLDTRRFLPENAATEMRFSIQRSGLLTGLAGWFELDLSPSVTLSNAPGTSIEVWGQAVFPLPRVEIHQGSELRVLVGLVRDSGGNVFWEWRGGITSAAGPIASFDRCSFRSLCLSRIFPPKVRSRSSPDRDEPPASRPVSTRSHERRGLGQTPDRAAPEHVPRRLSEPGKGRPSRRGAHRAVPVSMKATARPCRAPAVLSSRTVEDEVVLYGTADGVVHLLNEVAAHVWFLCDGTRTEADIVSAILELFEAPRATVERDVSGVVAELELRGLLVPQCSNGAGACRSGRNTADSSSGGNSADRPADAASALR